MNKIVISGLTWARRHKRDFDAVITVEDPTFRYGLRFHDHPHPDHLVLRFVDLDRSIGDSYDQRPDLRLAEQHHIEQAIAFGWGQGDMLIHCKVGIGRSTGVALAILAARFGMGFEQDAFDTLLAIRPEAVPNMQVVRLADDILGRNGALVKIVQDYDRQNPDAKIRRALNRAAHLDHARVAPEIEQELRKWARRYDFNPTPWVGEV